VQPLLPSKTNQSYDIKCHPSAGLVTAYVHKGRGLIKLSIKMKCPTQSNQTKAAVLIKYSAPCKIT